MKAQPGEGSFVVTKYEWVQFLRSIDKGYDLRLFGVALFNLLCPLTGERPIE